MRTIELRMEGLSCDDFSQRAKMSAQQPLKILFLSAEVVPFAKTGGLADVAGSLPKAVRALGHDIRIAMPRYGRISPEKFDLRPKIGPFPVPLDNLLEPAHILEGKIGKDLPVYFVENARLFDRDGIYMYPDDAERFIFFCRASLEMCRQMGWRPDVIHCNDWHTAIVPNWLQTIYRNDEFFKETATLYTIHNLAYQGIFGYRVLEIAGIDEYGFIAHPDLAPDLNDVVDLMARGILFADIINTVSERYAQEILTPAYGERLDPILRDRRDRLFGVLNGLDYEIYNPATDPHIASHFDREHLEARLPNKLALQQEAGLPERIDIPVIGAISRLADQKGFDLIAQIIDAWMQYLPSQFVLLGTGEQRYHELFESIRARYPDRVRVFLTFNAPLAQRIYAGSDMFLMPSRFEPCGLGQMIAMRYGSVPVVRATGGLADTVKDYNPRSDEGNGFSFEPYDAMALYTTLVRAVETYKYRDVWCKLMLRGMSADFSWERSAQKYVDLYYRAIAIRRGAHRPEEYGVLRHKGTAERMSGVE
ncbi:MAG: glycogen/starch synthase [Anaerolineae bacterium]|nr:glycogen/starch synthase [Anaerolineae bacterium]